MLNVVGVGRLFSSHAKLRGPPARSARKDCGGASSPAMDGQLPEEQRLQKSSMTHVTARGGLACLRG